MENNESGFIKLLDLVGGLESLLVCMEHTGIYSFPLCNYLRKAGISYTLIAALEIKRSLGIQRGKNDKSDARSIARYGYLFQGEMILQTLPEDLLLKLKLLQSQRDRFLKAKKAIMTSSKELNGFVEDDMISSIQASSVEVLRSLTTEIKKLDHEMILLIKSDEELQNTYDLCRSVPGIGTQISIYLIVSTRCFKSFKTGRQFSCYSGIAPFEHTSGSSIRGRSKVSSLANKKAKSLLSMGALVAIRCDREIQAYFQRKVNEGKNKMAVLNAVRNKLILRVFATVQRGTPFIAIAKY